MDYSDFVPLGFNVNEAKVYVAMLKRGTADAATIIRDTKFHKDVVYDNLAKLSDKGLITYIITQGKRIYNTTPADQLTAHIDKQEAELAKKQAQAQKLVEQINKLRTSAPIDRKAEIYSGVSGIKTFYAETLKGPDYCAFGAPQAAIDIMTPTYFANHIRKRIDRKIKARFIFNVSAREYATSIRGSYTQVRFFNEDFEPLTETHIQKHAVAFIVWTEEPVAFVIRDPLVAQNYQEYFEALWKMASE